MKINIGRYLYETAKAAGLAQDRIDNLERHFFDETDDPYSRKWRDCLPENEKDVVRLWDEKFSEVFWYAWQYIHDEGKECKNDKKQ